MRRRLNVMLSALGAVLLITGSAFAQTGTIAGQARDASGAALPGVTVEVTSPALIEKVRSTTTDQNGRYQITALPVGTYDVSFGLTSFATFKRTNVVVTSDFTANVVADMKVGELKDTVSVVAEAPLVDVQRAQQQVVFQGAEIRDLPTTRNIADLMVLVPGLTAPRGIGGFFRPQQTSATGQIAGDGSFRTGAGWDTGIRNIGPIPLGMLAPRPLGYRVGGVCAGADLRTATVSRVRTVPAGQAFQTTFRCPARTPQPLGAVYAAANAAAAGQILATGAFRTGARTWVTGVRNVSDKPQAGASGAICVR